jgi:streptogramin lyase
MGRSSRCTAAGIAAITFGALVAVITPTPASSLVGTPVVVRAAEPDLDGADGIAAAPDGSLYVAAYDADALAHYDPLTDTLTAIADDDDAEDDFSDPSRVVVDQVSGDVWYTNWDTPSIGRYDPDTGETEIFSDAALEGPWGIVLDAEGDAWFADYDGDVIGEVDHVSGDVRVIEDVAFEGPNELAFGADGRLWFTNYNGDDIGVVDLDTEDVSLFTDPAIDDPWAITRVGSDLWFTSHLGGQIGRITPSGTITLFGDPDTNGRPVGIDPGPNGTVWFSFRSSPGFTNGGIGRLTTATGNIVVYPEDVPSLQGGVADLEPAAGPGVDGADETWFYVNDYFLDGFVAVEAAEAAFVDVGVDHPFFDEIGFMSDEGISTGYAGGLYKPSDPVSRGAMSAFMYRLAGEPEFEDPEAPSFVDVALTHPFFHEVEWMAAEDITTGYAGDLYKPAAPVSRGAMSAFMYRFADEPTFEVPTTATFSDVGLAHPFFHEVEWMNEAGVTTGYLDGTYRPAAPVTRAAMSAFMYRLFVHVLD